MASDSADYEIFEVTDTRVLLLLDYHEKSAQLTKIMSIYLCGGGVVTKQEILV
jgi:hypothetical protein